MPEPEPNTSALDRTAARIAIAAVAIGVVLRIWVLTQRGSLWLDEASLALNVLGRDFAGLLRPLDWGQAAPVGFLWLERALTGLLGTAEWVLRLLPAMAGGVTIWLVWEVGRRSVGRLAGALTAAALAGSLIAIRYSAEAKPYATDACVALALVALALAVLERPEALRRWAMLGAAGAIAVTFSLPSVFVLGAIGIAVAPSAWRGRLAIRFTAVAAGLSWLAVFGALWALVIRESSGGAYLREYWAPVMLAVSAPDFVARLIRAVASVVATPLQWTGSVTLALMMTAVWLVGLAMLAWRNWCHAVLLAGPFLLAAIASMIGVYPLSDRLAFFASPLALLTAALPVGLVVARVSASGASPARLAAPWLVAPWLAALAVAGWVGSDAWRIVRAPGALEPTRALFRSVKATADSSGAGVYVFARAVPAWLYATTDWKAIDRARLAAYVEASGGTDSQGHENFARPGGISPGDGEGLVGRAEFATRGGRSAFTALEFIGLAPGVRYRIAGPTSADAPSPGWAEEEARRISMIIDGSFTPVAWVVASHFFEGTARDELRPLVAAISAKGLQVAEERRGGRDAVALKVISPSRPAP